MAGASGVGLAGLVIVAALGHAGGFSGPGLAVPCARPAGPQGLLPAPLRAARGSHSAGAAAGLRVWSPRARGFGALALSARQEAAILTEVIVEPDLFSDAELRKYSGMDRACRVRRPLPGVCTRALRRLARRLPRAQSHRVRSDCRDACSQAPAPHRPAAPPRAGRCCGRTFPRS